MSWQQLSVITDKTTTMPLADFLSEAGALSVTFVDAEDVPIYEPALDTLEIWQQTKVVALYELEMDLTPLQTEILAQFSSALFHNWQIEILEDQDWERAWMEYYQPMKFANKLWVCPTGQEKNEEGCVCLTLDPGLAFGTGTHPTTALCLEWLASHDLQDKIVIDYGCGSGILAVAAILLGAKQVHAIDIDPQAISATLANAEKNQVTDKINCYLPEQFKPLIADIVLANILAKPLIELSPAISDLVKSDGDLILSGILKEQADAVRAAYQNFIFTPTIIQEDWCRLDGVKNL